MSRRLAREIVFKAIFQVDVGKCSVKRATESNLLGAKLSSNEKELVQELVSGTVEYLGRIDEILEKHLVNWQLVRLPAVDRNLLRLATFEILYRSDIPHAVSINEALELAKKYGSNTDSISFINGVLDRIAGELLGSEA